MDKKNIDYRTVLVTGGNNGIGLGMVKRLLEKGLQTVVIDIATENLTELKKRYEEQFVCFEGDVTDFERIKTIVQEVIQHFGSIDVLVNNACIAIFNTFEEKSIEQTYQEFEVNYFGYVHMIQAILPHMKSQGKGIIHNFSSGVGATGFPGLYGYASTKGAIEALTKTLALELRKYNICVNVIHPPLTRTKSSAPLGIPSEMMADPEQVGAKLADKIFSTRPIVTPDFQNRILTRLTLKYSYFFGRLLSKLTEKQLNRADSI